MYIISITDLNPPYSYVAKSLIVIINIPTIYYLSKACDDWREYSWSRFIENLEPQLENDV